MHKKPKNGRGDRHLPKAGICFEALEPRLLLSGSWGAVVDGHGADTPSDGHGGLTQGSMVLNTDTGINTIGSENRHLKPESGRVDLLSRAPALDTLGNPVPALDESSASTPAVPVIDHTTATPTADNKDNATQSDALDAAVRREVVLVNNNVEDYEGLITSLRGSDTNRIVEIVVLDADRDGIQQVSDILAGRSDISAVHIITHGSDGQINLGNTYLNSATLGQSSDAVVGWGRALTDTGDILFYGCNIAADSSGQNLLDDIAELTGTEVAASDDLTGSSELGGDWALEYVSGVIETENFDASNVKSAWVHLLAAPTITSDGGGDTATINVLENTTSVTTVTATDADTGDTLTYSIDPTSVDAARFSLDSITGELTFAAAPDFENPTDANADNGYEVTVQVSDGTTIDTQAISVNVSNASDSISGTAFIDEGGTHIGAGKTIHALVNGVSAGTGVTAADGSFTFDTGVFSTGDAVVLFIDNDATYKGVTITIADGSDLSGVAVFADRITVRHEGGGALTIADMDAALGAHSDTDIGYSVTAGALTVSGGALYVPAGHTFTPGGDITASGIESLGTFNGGIGAIHVSGDLTISGGNFTSTSGILRIQNPDDAGFTVRGGTFSHNSGTVEIATSASYRTLTVDIGTTVLNDVVVSASDRANVDVTGILAIDGDLTITAIANMRTGTLAVAGDIVTTDTDVRGDATLLLTGSNPQTINAGGQSGDLTRLTIDKSAGGTVDAGAAGTLSVENLTVSGGTFIAPGPGGTLRIENSDNDGFTVSGGTFSHNSGTVEIATSASYRTLTVDIGATVLNDVVVSASDRANVDVTGILAIDGDLTITAIANMRTGTLAVAGDIVTTDTDVRGDATLLLTGSNPQTINAGGQSGDLTRLTIDKSGLGTVDAGAAGTLSVENLTVSGGTFIAPGPGGTLRIENSDNDGFTVSGGTFSHNSGTVEIATSASYRTLTVDIGATVLNDVVVSASDRANVDVTGILAIDGDLTITAIANMRTGTLAVAGDIVTTDTDVRGDATLLLTGSNPQTINAGGQSGDLTRLTIDKSGLGTVDAGAAGTLSVENLTVSGGTFIAPGPGGTLRIENSDNDGFTVSGGTFSHNSGTVEIATSASYRTLTVDIGATVLNDVVVSASDRANVDVTGILAIDGDLTITAIANMRTGTLAVAGDIVTTDTDVRGDATLLLTGSNPQTINAGGQSGDLTRLTIDKSGLGTVDAGAAGTLSVENLTVSGGTFIAPGPGGTLRIENSDNDGFTVSGGTFSHNSGTVEIATSASYRTLTVDIGATVLNDVVVSASDRAYLDVTGNIDVDGNLTIAAISQINGGSINVANNLTTTDTGVSGTAAMILDGTGAQTIDAAGGGDLANGTFTIDKASGTVTLLSDLALNGAGQNLTLTQGTLDLAGFNLTVDDTLIVDADGTLRLEGGETVTAATSVFNVGSTVLYDGAGTFTGLLMGDAYANLIFDGTGSWTLDNALDVDGNLTIANGTLDLAGFNLTVDNMLTVDAGGTLQLEGGETVTTVTTTLNAGSTVLYDGAGTYTGLSVGDAYADLTFDGTGSWTLDNALDVDGNLTITSGTLDVDAANDYPIDVAGNWSNSGTFNSHSGTVFLDGGDQSLSGSTTFGNLTKIESTNDATDVTLTFDNTATQTITGTLTLDGLDADDRINLVSDSPTNQWRIDLTATAIKGTMAFLDVTDSDASGSDASQKPLNPTNSVNGGNNVAWFNSAPIARPDGVHLSFDGDDFIQVADDPSLQMTDNVTMEAWINHSGSGTGSQIIVNKEGEYEMGITADTGEIIYAIADPMSNWTWHHTGHFVTAGEWTHVAVTFDGVAGVVNTYINGDLVETFAQFGPIGDVYAMYDDLNIGGRENKTSQRFQGLIDEVRVWRTTRTQLEIQSNMDSLLTGTETGLAGNWRLDEAGDGNVIDQSPHGNDGTLGGVEGPSATPIYQGFFTDEDSQLTIPAGSGVLVNDFDPDGDPLAVSEINGSALDVGTPVILASGAQLTLNADGSAAYDPNGQFEYLDVGETATDTFTYAASDGNGGATTTTVSIIIKGAEDASSIGGAFTGAVEKDGSPTASGALTITDVDASDNPLSFNAVAPTPGDNGYGSFTLTGGTWTYTLNNAHAAVQAMRAGDTLTDVYTFTAGDGSTRVVTVTITGATTIVDPVTRGPVDPGGGDPGPGFEIDPIEPDPEPESELPPDEILPIEDELPSPEELIVSNLSSSKLPVITPLQWADPTYFVPTISLLTTDHVLPNQNGSPSGVAGMVKFLQRELASQTIARFAPTVSAFFSTEAMNQTLDHIQQQLGQTVEMDGKRGQLIIGAATGLGASVFAGYVIWAFRGSSLLLGALTAMPMWRCFDPLPVLMGNDKKRWDRHEAKSTQHDLDKDETTVKELLGEKQAAKDVEGLKG